MALHPEARTMFLNHMDRELFKKTRLRLYKRLTKIIHTSSNLRGTSDHCLMFNGEVYRIGDKTQPLPKPLHLVHPEVRDDLKQYIVDYTEYERERDLTLGFLGMILLETDRVADLYRLLPPALQGAVAKVSGLFHQGPAKFDPESAEEFMQTHSRYVAMLKARLVYNMCDVVTV